MSSKIKRLFGVGNDEIEPEPLGEDMAPPPHALAERTALSDADLKIADTRTSGPFVSAANAPLRDFTG